MNPKTAIIKQKTRRILRKLQDDCETPEENLAKTKRFLVFFFNFLNISSEALPQRRVPRDFIDKTRENWRKRWIFPHFLRKLSFFSKEPDIFAVQAASKSDNSRESAEKSATFSEKATISQRKARKLQAGRTKGPSYWEKAQENRDKRRFLNNFIEFSKKKR